MTRQNFVPPTRRSWYTRMASVMRQLHTLAEEVCETQSNEPIRIVGMTNTISGYKLLVTDGQDVAAVRAIEVSEVAVLGEDYA